MEKRACVVALHTGSWGLRVLSCVRWESPGAFFSPIGSREKLRSHRPPITKGNGVVSGPLLDSQARRRRASARPIFALSLLLFHASAASSALKMVKMRLKMVKLLLKMVQMHSQMVKMHLQMVKMHLQIVKMHLQMIKMHLQMIKHAPFSTQLSPLVLHFRTSNPCKNKPPTTERTTN